MNLTLRCAGVLPLLAAIGLSGCDHNDIPTGPNGPIPPTLHFQPGQALTYLRQNFDVNYARTGSFQEDLEVLSTGWRFGGLHDVASVGVASAPGSGGPTRRDTVMVAVDAGRLMIFDSRSQAPGRYPALPAWNTLIDLVPGPSPDTLLSFDTTFALRMLSGHLLRDRVRCAVTTRFAAEDRISAFGSPLINTFVYTRNLSYEETVDTAGILLFQGTAVALLDSIWFADGIGPVRLTSKGTTLEVDSLGLPFSLSALQVAHTDSTHDSYEVHYSRSGAQEVLSMRNGLYYFPATAYTVVTAYDRSFGPGLFRHNAGSPSHQPLHRSDFARDR